jgi:hypothetical protein
VPDRYMLGSKEQTFSGGFVIRQMLESYSRNIYFRDGECTRTMEIITDSLPEINVRVNCFLNLRGSLADDHIYPGAIPECTRCLADTCSDLKSKRIVKGYRR